MLLLPLSPICKSATPVRVTIALITVFMIISSPVFMLPSPTQASAATTYNMSRADTSSNNHSIPRIPETASQSSSATPSAMAPSTLSQGGDFTNQGALLIPVATPKSDIVNSFVTYEVKFKPLGDELIKEGAYFNDGNHTYHIEYTDNPISYSDEIFDHIVNSFKFIPIVKDINSDIS